MLEAILFAAPFPIAYHLILTTIKRRISTNKELVSITKLDYDLWIRMSKYIRIKNSDWKGVATCFTCGRRDDYRLMDAGHYIPKAISGSVLKFYERNVHVQCQDCNRLKGGNYDEYRRRLIVKYGEGIIDELNALRNALPMTVSEYQKRIKYYSQWFKEHSL